MRQSLAPRRRAQGPVGLRRFNAAAGEFPWNTPASAGSFARCWHCQPVIRLFLTAFPSPTRRDGGKHGSSQGNETAPTTFPLQGGISDFMWKDNHSRMGQWSVMVMAMPIAMIMAMKEATRSAKRTGRRESRLIKGRCSTLSIRQAARGLPKKTGRPLHPSASGLIVPLISAERVPFAAAGWPGPTWRWPPAR
jgi:hypothetical protein